MAKSEARRQKQLAKKKSKRDDRRSVLTRRNSDDPNVRLADAEHWPIVATIIPESVWSEGIGNCTITRRTPNGQIAFACFLVDAWCLGVKNALWKIGSQSDLDDLISRIKRNSAIEDATPERFAKLIYSAVEYAQSIGFQPHPDYNHARQLLKGIDPTLCSEVFEFGQNGKPFFVNGPNDSPAKIKIIMHRLSQVGGDFTIQTDPGMSMDDQGDVPEMSEFEDGEREK